MVKKAAQSYKQRKAITLAAIGLLIIVVVITSLEITNTTYLFHKRRPVSSTIYVNNAHSEQSSTNTITPTPSPKPAQPATSSSTSTKSTAPASSNGALIAPFGLLVSNHAPNLSGSPAPSKLRSVCNTTPGASCYIQFTQDGAVKTLPTEVVDSTGTASWDNWDLNANGFTTGEWRITAAATLNGQTKSTIDQRPLNVQP